MNKILIIVAIVVILFQILYFRYISPWGDGLAPIYIPAIVTFLYALWSKNKMLSFLVGFFSLMAMFIAPMLYYMELSPIDIFIPILIWCSIFGLFGVGIVLLIRKITR
ncbi:MAG: hypothetical protein QW806_08725 [Nitrososphaerota archaeon]